MFQQKPLHQILCPTRVTLHSSFLSPTTAFFSALTVTHKISRISYYYIALSPNFPHAVAKSSLMLLTNTKRLCWLRNLPEWIKAKETQDLATRTVLGIPRLIPECFGSYNIKYNSTRDQLHWITQTLLKI